MRKRQWAETLVSKSARFQIFLIARHKQLSSIPNRPERVSHQFGSFARLEQKLLSERFPFATGRLALRHRR